MIGALVVGDSSSNHEDNARKAVEAVVKIRKLLFRGDERGGSFDVIGAGADSSKGEIRYFVCLDENLKKMLEVDADESPEKFVWERGCLVRCEVDVNLPVYYALDKPSDSENMLSSAVDAAIAKFKDPNVVFLIDGTIEGSSGATPTAIVHGAELDFQIDMSDVKVGENTSGSSGKFLFCSDFCSTNRPLRTFGISENADTIHINIFFNHSGKSQNTSAPIAEYFPALGPTKLLAVSIKIEVLCYAGKDHPMKYVIPELIIPGLGDQLISMKKTLMPNISAQHPQLKTFHFWPPGMLHPITAIYELNYGETEMKQVEVRRSLHMRLGLPLDRPLLLVSNALKFATDTGIAGSDSVRNASSLLKDVHTEVPSSGVSGGLISRVGGSYEYYHYLQNSFDDSGWGCAYRSLQTIISWFRLQHYTSIDVPSHRGIQQALVEIGDKDPSFIGSREWIGAIELSFVLDKLLGVSCKIMNVRSGAELPEKCRELALHFESQGTPVMIGGGVLAYTLLGVDYNEENGDCAFLILDPHYTGNDELKKIVNGGWCAWKKAVDSKGKSFFLHDKFYNLLLPQRPNMV